MTAQLLPRSARRAPQILQVLDKLEFATGRAHEICGPARRTLSLTVAAATQGPVFWIQPSWMPDRLYPDTVNRLLPPGRLTYIDPQRPEDLLWTMEEVLRSGAVPLVVADLHAVPGLTAVRRLHLAAETGAEGNGFAPLGLILTAGDGGAPGVETRHHIAPDHAADLSAWRLERRRARTAPPCSWQMRREGGQFCLHPPKNVATPALA
ncbi:hypothetical protein ACMU_11595 [Actibacterium mucosum KCTC 23349]|uniref:Uncharacterized protein n=1 Tax=Actibacterium mucosum KCTC 23349 TaxID=1454373 RepID=A0A037ZIF6_9RHOB|nr:hypothetical protein [Actibacterium mucosum]KAJ55332.1 hypothetical protein ACMU_11595 [Actibacterium mucosum KCTC 23349]